MFDTLNNASAIRFDKMEAGLWHHAHKRSNFSAIPVIPDDVREGNIRQAIRVIGQEHFFAFELLFDRLQPLTDIGGQPGINKRDAPVMDVLLQELDILPPSGEDKIIRKPFIILEEIPLDDVPFVAQTENEIVVAVMRVVPHYMPENRPITDR